MSAAVRLTFDPVIVEGVVTEAATRPSMEDLGGGVLRDDSSNPPSKDGSMPYADQLNQWAKQLFGLGKMEPSARMSVAFLAGDPFIAKLTTPSGILTADDFTVTDNGVGLTTISWAAGKLPPVECDPGYWLRDDSVVSAVLSANLRVISATSVQMRTYSGGVLADVRFTLAIH
jgi:hypothetical protein